MQEFGSFTSLNVDTRSFSDRVNELAVDLIAAIPPGEDVEIDLSTVESELKKIAEQANIQSETLEFLLRKAVERNIHLTQATGEEIDDVDIDLEMEGRT